MTDGATPQPDAGNPFPVDAHVPEASVEASIDTGVACTTDNDYFVAVNDDASTEIFEAGCAPFTAPSAGDIVGCGHKNVCLGVVACGAGYLYVGTMLASEATPPGSFPVTVQYAPTGGGSEQDYAGTLNVSNIVDGMLGGTFTSTGPSGTFCVKWM